MEWQTDEEIRPIYVAWTLGATIEKSDKKDVWEPHTTYAERQEPVSMYKLYALVYEPGFRDDEDSNVLRFRIKPNN